mmetsp:Transcript_84166/g.234654  ORF Transcript_84166/g.234654 Transcript_84166/m.234654 type:complete len:416 (+) Transcript_84166:907-2154(+)
MTCRMSSSFSNSRVCTCRSSRFSASSSAPAFRPPWRSSACKELFSVSSARSAMLSSCTTRSAYCCCSACSLSSRRTTPSNRPRSAWALPPAASCSLADAECRPATPLLPSPRRESIGAPAPSLAKPVVAVDRCRVRPPVAGLSKPRGLRSTALSARGLRGLRGLRSVEERSPPKLMLATLCSAASKRLARRWSFSFLSRAWERSNCSTRWRNRCIATVAPDLVSATPPTEPPMAKVPFHGSGSTATGLRARELETDSAGALRVAGDTALCCAGLLNMAPLLAELPSNVLVLRPPLVGEGPVPYTANALPLPATLAEGDTLLHVLPSPCRTKARRSSKSPRAKRAARASSSAPTLASTSRSRSTSNWLFSASALRRFASARVRCSLPSNSSLHWAMYCTLTSRSSGSVFAAAAATS